MPVQTRRSAAALAGVLFPLDLLPDLALEKVLSCLPYEEIAKCRMVSRRFNRACQHLLNCGFLALERFNTECYLEVEAQLPTSGLERLSHPLMGHSDVLNAVEVTLSHLNVTFGCYVKNDICCYAPGRIIDGLYDILREVRKTKPPLDAFSCSEMMKSLDNYSKIVQYCDEQLERKYRSGNKPQCSGKLVSDDLLYRINDVSRMIKASAYLRSQVVAMIEKIMTLNMDMSKENAFLDTLNKHNNDLAAIRKKMIDHKDNLQVFYQKCAARCITDIKTPERVVIRRVYNLRKRKATGQVKMPVRKRHRR